MSNVKELRASMNGRIRNVTASTLNN